MMAGRIEASEARSLAQKLYGQCRDSTGPFKSLAATLRRLRNIFEEIEELLDDPRIQSPDGIKLLDQTREAGAALGSLDHAFQLYRCSASKEIDDETVSGFRITLGESLRSMSCAFKLLTAEKDKTQSEETQITTPADEKVFIDYNSTDALQRSSISWRSSASALPFTWQSPFASPDPLLSIGLEEATFQLMNGDDDDGDGRIDALYGEGWSRPNRPVRSFSDTVGFDHHPSITPRTTDRSGDITEKYPGPDDQSRAERVEPTISKTTSLPEIRINGKKTLPEGGSAESETMTSPNSAPEVSNNPVSKEIGTSPRNRRPVYPNTTPSLTVTGPAGENLDGRSDIDGSAASQYSIDTTFGASDGSQKLETSRSSSSTKIRASSVTSDDSIPQQSRPLKRSTAKHRRNSSLYRVVNIGPQDPTGSDDELYTSSWPSSPTGAIGSQASLATDADESKRKPTPTADLEGFSDGKIVESHPNEGVFTSQTTKVESVPNGEGSNTVRGIAPAAEKEVALGDEKEMVPQPDLETKDTALSPRKQLQPQMRPPRTRADGVVEADSGSPLRSDRTARPADSPMLIETPSTTGNASTAPIPTSTEGHANVSHDTVDGLDDERIEHCVHFWNSRQWSQAELYLSAYRAYLVQRDDLDTARRVQHLLGVLASFQGHISVAITRFLSVLRTPITGESDLDAGDCAAAYWLGDAYALRNQRVEAALAYSIAALGPIFHDETQPDLLNCVLAEQEAVMLGMPRREFKVLWANATRDRKDQEGRSILDPSVIVPEAARALLSEGLRTPELRDPFRLRPGQERAKIFYDLHKGYVDRPYRTIGIDKKSFDRESPWPLPFDPFFAMAHVQRGRLLSYECDLLEVFQTNANARVSRAGVMKLGRIDSITSTDLNWLIVAIRDCLRACEMTWAEVANVEGVWFVVEYPHVEDLITIAHYSSIALYRHSVRPGYGVDICPSGIYGSRIVKNAAGYKKGVSSAEVTRIKQSLRDRLDNISKQQAEGRRKSARIQ